MIFWMRRTAATSKRSCTGASTPHWRLVAWRWCSPRSSRSAGRPGLERALFLWSAVQATGQSSAPLVGIVAGLGVAVVLGYLLYRRAVALNLAKFFTYTCLHVGGQRGRAEGAPSRRRTPPAEVATTSLPAGRTTFAGSDVVATSAVG